MALRLLFGDSLLVGPLLLFNVLLQFLYLLLVYFNERVLPVYLSPQLLHLVLQGVVIVGLYVNSRDLPDGIRYLLLLHQLDD